MRPWRVCCMFPTSPHLVHCTPVEGYKQLWISRKTDTRAGTEVGVSINHTSGSAEGHSSWRASLTKCKDIYGSALTWWLAPDHTLLFCPPWCSPRILQWLLLGPDTSLVLSCTWWQLHWPPLTLSHPWRDTISPNFVDYCSHLPWIFGEKSLPQFENYCCSLMPITFRFITRMHPKQM